MVARSLCLVAVLLGAACGPVVLWHGRSADRRVGVVVEERFAAQRVLFAGTAGQPFEAVGFQELVISPNGSAVAYPARSRGRWAMVVQSLRGSTDGRPWDAVSETTWSDDSEHLAYAAEAGGRWRIVLDGTPGRPWDGLRRGSIALSRDARRMAYVAEEAGETFVVVDGRARGPFDEAAELTLAEDGDRVGYVVTRRGRERAVVDGEASRPHRQVRSLVLAAGGHVGYLAEDRGRWRAFVDGESQRPAVESAEALAISPDGSSWAFAARHGKAAFVVHDGAIGPPYDGVAAGTLAFSPGGGHLVYVAQSGGGHFAVVDGEPGPAFEEVDEPVFSGDDESWGYVGRRGGAAAVIIDGNEVAVESWAGGLRVGPDGEAIAYVARRSGRSAVVHRGKATLFDVVVEDSLALSDDGRHWACLAGDASTKAIFVSIDGTTRRPFDLDEIAAAQMQERSLVARRRVGEKLLKRIVRAELALALAAR